MAEFHRCRGTWAYCDGHCERCNTTATTQTSGTYSVPLTAYVRDTVRGSWVESNESVLRPYRCSNCGCHYDADTVMGKIVWNYCPNCGAKMDCEE